MTSRPFRLVEEVIPEAALQEQVCRILDALLLPPAFFFSAAIGAAKLSAQQAAALSRAGVKRGLPDIFIIAPKDIAQGWAAPDGEARIYGIELKKAGSGPRGGGGGTLSKTRIVRTRKGSPRILIGQIERFAELERAGMKIAVATSIDEVLNLLQEWGIPLRGGVAA